MKTLIRNLPVLVLIIMIATCAAVDIRIVGRPDHLVSKAPIAAVTILFALLLNIPRRAASKR